MTAPDAGYAPDPAAIVSAADVLRAHMQREAPDVAALMFNADFEGLAMALDEAGRLLPADAETRTEWTWRHNRFIATHDVDPERYRAERDAATCQAGFPGDDVGVVRRTVSTWPDGSTLVGPWLPAPTDTEES